jgi:lipopolysaccharide transport system ATP-binding protein
VRSKFDEIVEFSEVEKFLDTPVKRYSSGMHVRLAFAVAAHLEPEILIVDEVLAVGDAAFQRKCLGKMSDVAQSGRTVILVSHNMSAIQQLCETALWIHEGALKEFGPTDQVVATYSESFTGGAGGEISERAVAGDGTVKLVSYEVLNKDREATPLPVTGEDVVIRVNVDVREPLSQPYVGVSLATASGIRVTRVSSLEQGVDPRPWPVGPMAVDIIVHGAPYLPGPYKADVWIENAQGHVHAEAFDAIRFEMGETPLYGVSQVDQRWGVVYSDIEFAPRVPDGTR